MIVKTDPQIIGLSFIITVNIQVSAAITEIKWRWKYVHVQYKKYLSSQLNSMTLKNVKYNTSSATIHSFQGFSWYKSPLFFQFSFSHQSSFSAIYRYNISVWKQFLTASPSSWVLIKSSFQGAQITLLMKAWRLHRYSALLNLTVTEKLIKM